MQEEKNPDENKKPEDNYGQSGGYFGENNTPGGAPEESPPAPGNSQNEDTKESTTPPSQQPSVDNFSAPGQGQAPPSTPSEGAQGELRMPSEGEIEEPEKKVDIRETEAGGEAEDIFERKEEPQEAPKQEPEMKEPEEPKIEPEKKETEGEQKLGEIEPEKKGGFFRCCLIALIIFVVIILGLGALIYLNETGIWDNGLEKYYGQIGLERLWGGLGKDGKAAVVSAVNKMSEKKSFSFSGQDQFSLEVSSVSQTKNKSTTATAREKETSAQLADILGVEENSITALINQGFDVSTKIEIVGKVQDENKYEVNFEIGLIDIINQVIGTSNEVELSIIRNEDSVFIKSAALNSIIKSEKEWLKINTDEESLSSVISLAGIVTSGERTGTEKVDGVSCYAYNLRINGQQLAQYLSGQLSIISDLISEISVIQAKVYIGKKDHLIRKFEISASESSGRISISNNISLLFGGFGESQEISLPDAEEAKEEQWQTIKNYFLGTETSTELTVEQKDAQRKKDLNSIKTALQACQETEGSYPSTDGEIIKTRDKNTVLSQALVPDYLENLPVDPETDKYYYGYSSDGASFKLTAILENTDDPEGILVGDYFLYVIEI